MGDRGGNAMFVFGNSKPNFSMRMVDIEIKETYKYSTPSICTTMEDDFCKMNRD